ncbi:NADPH-dependent F420 reductase [Halobacteria archaeon AArc-m2/3/4]|uniref:NADPH-dependent F420 reductase n=1 Tax=Natronoglomus mannanivorans TaxID=2979990 RepID=A0ABT2QEX6_9EURY|nr:NADPH-dependent F420 reductase [Halobacteria archaeon AArc-m2/3/4]
MRIALVGGTGELGEGLALRLGRDTGFELTIGSRDQRKASECAEAYRRELRRHDVDRRMDAATNESAAAEATVVVLSVPPYYVTETVEAIEPALDSETVLVSPAVGMSGHDDGVRYNPPPAGSVTELVVETAPDDVPVVGAFANVPGARIANLDERIEIDTPVVGDSSAAKEVVIDVVSELDGIRAVDAGPLSNAAAVEAITPFLITLAQQNEGFVDLGVKFV